MRVSPEVKVLRYSDPDRLSLAKAAAIFLGKPDEDNVKRPLSMIRQKHKSIFRGEHVRFEFVTSKVVYDHLVTYTTANVRACAGLRANKAGEFVLPLEVDQLPDPWEAQVFTDIGERHLRDYDSLTKGIDPETQDPIKKARLQAARAVAPMSVNLHYMIEFNFLTLIEALFPQRIWEPGAQPDTREVVQMMWDLVRPLDPDLWDTAYEVFGPEAIAWEKLRHRLKRQGVSLGTMEQLCRAHPEKWGKTVVEYLLEAYGQQRSMWD